MESYPIETHEELLQIDGLIDRYNSERPKLQEFVAAGTHTQEEVNSDLAFCEKRLQDNRRLNQIGDWDRQQIEFHKDELGKSAEIALFYATKEYNWFGPDADVTLSSEYDDLVNGIDCVVEFTNEAGENSHVGVAVDFATSPDTIKKKLEKIFIDLDSGDVKKIKYYKSADGEMAKNVPMIKIILGGDKESAKKLEAYTAEIMSASGLKSESEERLRNDDFQQVMFGEILMQLDVFTNRLSKVVSEATRERRPDIAKSASVNRKMHESVHAAIQKVMAQKNINLRTLGTKMRSEKFAKNLLISLHEYASEPVRIYKEGTLARRSS